MVHCKPYACNTKHNLSPFLPLSIEHFYPPLFGVFWTLTHVSTPWIIRLNTYRWRGEK
jgi:hypothetical protein